MKTVLYVTLNWDLGQSWGMGKVVPHFFGCQERDIVFLSNWVCCPVSYSLLRWQSDYLTSNFRKRTGHTALIPFSWEPNNSQKAHLFSILSGKKKHLLSQEVCGDFCPWPGEQVCFRPEFSTRMPAHLTHALPWPSYSWKAGMFAVSPLPRTVLGTE